MWVTWQPDWSKECGPCWSALPCMNVVWLSLILPRHPANVVLNVCQLPKFKFLAILELFSCDVISWQLSPVVIPVQNSPSKTCHHLGMKCINFTGSSVTRKHLEPLQQLWCQMLDSRRPRVAPSEARSLGSLALRVREDADQCEVLITLSFGCCNRLQQQRAVKHNFKSGLVSGFNLNISCSDNRSQGPLKITV